MRKNDLVLRSGSYDPFGKIIVMNNGPEGIRVVGTDSSWNEKLERTRSWKVLKF